MRYFFLLFLAATSFLFVLSGCGSGGSGATSAGSAGNPPSSGYVISGVASKGLITGGTINIFKLDSNGNKGDQLATATTGSNGDYNAIVVPDKDGKVYTGPVLVEASGGSYVDEATGKTITIDSSSPLLRAAFANVTGSTFVAVTPFTEMAVRMATSLTSTNISKANDLISTIFPFDAINTKPLAVTVAALQSATQTQRDYTLALAAFSQMANGGSIDSLIATMSIDIINHGSLTTTATDFINAFHAYLDNNYFIKKVVQDRGGSPLELIGSATLPVNSIAIGQNGTIYAGINAFTSFSSAKINIQSNSSVSVYKLTPSNPWVQCGKITNAVNSSKAKLIIAPNSATIYAGFDGTIFKSVDSGKSWADISYVDSVNKVGLLEDIAVDSSSSIVYLATINSIYKSNISNGWDTKTLPSETYTKDGIIYNKLATIYSIAIDPSNPDILYAGGQFGVWDNNRNYMGTDGTGVYKSIDGGAHWNAMNTGLTFTENGNTFLTEISSIAIDPANTSTIYATSYNPNGAVFKSTNGGGSWTAIINGNSGNIIADRFLKVTVDPFNTSRVYVIGINGLYYQDSGGTWNTILTTAGFTRNIQDLAIDPSSNLYVMYSSGILKGTFDANNLISWSNIMQ